MISAIVDEESQEKTYQVALEKVRDVVQDESFGFIGSAFSWWDALGIEVWHRQLRLSGDDRQGVVFLMPHPKHGRILDATHVPGCQADHRTTVLSVDRMLPVQRTEVLRLASRLSVRASRLMLRRRIGVTSEPSRTLQVVSPRAPDVFTLLELADEVIGQRNIEFVMMDEGLSTYLPRNVVKMMRRGDVPSAPGAAVWRECDLFLRRGYEQVQTHVAGRFLQRKQHLFDIDATNGELRVNRRMARDYRDVLGQISQQLPALPRSGRPIALILSQPWLEYRQFDWESERPLLKHVVRRLDALGYDVCFKLHPRDGGSPYEQLCETEPCRILSQQAAVESLYPKLMPGDLVVGYNSTSLLTARALFDLPAYTLGEALLAQTKTGGIFQAFQQGFRQLAGELVSDIRDIVSSA